MTKTNSRLSRFWKGFSDEPTDFTGKRVLEIGCGRGDRCFQMIEMGAQEIVGLDTHLPSIEIARARLADHADATKSKLHFHAGDLASFDGREFDIIISEDSFEHIMNVPEVLDLMYEKVSSDAKIYLGFGPLYYSPFGDHGWMRQVLPFRRFFSWPWGHVIFSDKYIFRQLSKKHGTRIDRVSDWPYWDLNRKTYFDFLDDFSKSKFDVSSINTNPSFSTFGHLMSLLGKLPFGKKYFVWGLYVILTKN